MKIVNTVAETRATLRSLRSVCSAPQASVGLVPTMGALHEGHLSLVRAARAACDIVVASIFVNPTQFGPNEDLAKYPRTFEADCDLLRTEEVDLLFAPAAADMYPSGELSTSVEPGELGTRLDGRSRPGHFRGVATVVTKLFNIIGPDHAFFGQKDAAQVAVLRALVRDLDLHVNMIICPTVRDADGLALSSRNRYLTPEQRQTALALSQALLCAERAFARGEDDPTTLTTRMRAHLAPPAIRIDYVEAVHPESLLPVARAVPGTLLAVAAWVGETRLIDNVVLPVAAERQ